MGGCLVKDASIVDEKHGSGSSAKDGGSGGFWMFGGGSSAKYVDPPMPEIGRKVDFDKLLKRKQNVKAASKIMFKVIHKDLEAAIIESSKIPVSDQLERVIVTNEIKGLIGKRCSKREDRRFVKDNLLESQKYLSLRRTALDMLNHNYDDDTVRVLESIYVDETRTRLELRGDDEDNLPPASN